MDLTDTLLTVGLVISFLFYITDSSFTFTIGNPK